MSDLVRYRTPIYDNLRWQGFEHREGDILVCTPPKCGTTWTQMLCALLIFDGAELPATLDDLSPWLDMNTRSKREVFELLAAQTHRRFIKTHTPFDGLAIDPRVTYLVVGRDPRDVMVSWEHHMQNLDFEAFFRAREAAVGNADLAEFGERPQPSEDPVERFRQFVDAPYDPIANVTLAAVIQFLEQGWRRRHEPNVFLFHFADYQRDLAGELVRLSQVLGRPVTRERAAELATAAGLGRMREQAERFAPDIGRNHWKDPKRFFRSGGSGEWRERVSDADLEHYAKRVETLCPDADFAAWLHAGRLETSADV